MSIRKGIDVNDTNFDVTNATTTTTMTTNTATANAYTMLLQKKLFHIDHSEFVCGWGAAFINITVTYPIYKIIFRQVSYTFFFFLSYVLFFHSNSIFEDVTWC